MNFKPMTFMALFVGVLYLLLSVVAPVADAALGNLEDGINDQFKVCLSCGDCEPKEAAVCEKCGGADFAVNWCGGCEAAFEDDVDFTFCPNCGRKS